MMLRSLAATLAVLTFVLMLLGGVVHSTGSSLACPDWPLCYGEVFPPMRGGIRFEHGHRLLASLVAALTAALCATLYSAHGGRLRALGFVGVALVLVQACLGGLTVVLKLPPVVSIAHLGTSMLFFAWAMAINVRLITEDKGSRQALCPEGRRAVGVAAALVYLQIVLGAVVRHRGASMTCGYDAFLCAGAALPENGLQWLQSAHRALALGVCAAVVYATLAPMRAARAAARPGVRRLGLAAHILVLAQLALGVAVIKTGVNMHVVTTHLGLGALLWGTMVCLYLNLLAPSAAMGTAALASERGLGAAQAAAGGVARELDGAC